MTSEHSVMVAMREESGRNTDAVRLRRGNKDQGGKGSSNGVETGVRFKRVQLRIIANPSPRQSNGARGKVDSRRGQ